MSLDKAINHGKEHRKQYRGCKAYDKSCRNHGGCKWCEEGRLHKFKKDEPVEDLNGFKTTGFQVMHQEEMLTLDSVKEALNHIRNIPVPESFCFYQVKGVSKEQMRQVSEEHPSDMFICFDGTRYRNGKEIGKEK